MITKDFTRLRLREKPQGDLLLHKSDVLGTLKRHEAPASPHLLRAGNIKGIGLLCVRSE